MLQVAKERIGWDEWKKKQAAARKEGRWIGIGIGTTLDSGTNNFGQSQIVNPGAPFSGNSQGANCKLDIYGEVVVAVGSCPQGQGHETTAAQVVADVLNIHPDLITVRTGFDTERNVHTGFSGTYASQFAVSGLSAVHGAAQKLKTEMKRLAAFVLETKEDDLEFGTGEQGPEIRAKSTGKSINYWGLANIVNVNSAVLPPELYELTLNCRYIWRAPFKVPDKQKKYGNLTLTYASQLHIAVIEIERDTFIPRILDYVAVDDCGTVINPPIVEGQVYGATAHGIGAALMETCAYDAVGNMLTSTFSDYTPITAMNIPKMKYGSHRNSFAPQLQRRQGDGRGRRSSHPHDFSGAAGCAVCQRHLDRRFVQQRRQLVPGDGRERDQSSEEAGKGRKAMRPCGAGALARVSRRVMSVHESLHHRLWRHRQPLRGAPGAGCRGLGFRPPRRSRASSEPRRSARFGNARVSCSLKATTEPETAGLRTRHRGHQSHAGRGIISPGRSTASIRARSSPPRTESAAKRSSLPTRAGKSSGARLS